MKLTIIILVVFAITLTACDKYTICECKITNTNKSTGGVKSRDTTFHAIHTKTGWEGQMECDKYDGTKTYSSKGDSIVEGMNCSYLAHGTGVGP